jgi:hypothetical protein
MGEQSSDCMAVSLITNIIIVCSFEDAVSSLFSLSSNVLDLWNARFKDEDVAKLGLYLKILFVQRSKHTPYRL